MKELDQEYGKALTPKQLADFLGIDPRTVLKYRDRWGGVQVSPGIWRFFEKTIKEVINNVVHQEPSRKEEICRHRACNPSGRSGERRTPWPHKRMDSQPSTSILSLSLTFYTPHFTDNFTDRKNRG